MSNQQWLEQHHINFLMAGGELHVGQTRLSFRAPAPPQQQSFPAGPANAGAPHAGPPPGFAQMGSVPQAQMGQQYQQARYISKLYKAAGT